MKNLSIQDPNLQEMAPIYSIKCTHDCISAVCNALTTAMNTAVQHRSLIGIDEYLSHFGEMYGIPSDTITHMQMAVSSCLRKLGYER